MITGNCNSKFFFNFLYGFLFTQICLHFFSYSGEGFFILYKEVEENREIRNVRLVGNTDDSSIFLIVAVFCGQSKLSDVHEYLKDFIQEYKNIRDFGLIIDTKLYSVTISVFICDAPARAFVKVIKGHTARKKRLAATAKN